MTENKYRKHNGSWFRGKCATINKTISNNGGKVINAGEVVTISGKSGRGGFNVMANISRVSISCVDYEDIDLNDD